MIVARVVRCRWPVLVASVRVVKSGRNKRKYDVVFLRLTSQARAHDSKRCGWVASAARGGGCRKPFSRLYSAPGVLRLLFPSMDDVFYRNKSAGDAFFSKNLCILGRNQSVGGGVVEIRKSDSERALVLETKPNN
jgi:hypothetical protein